MFAAIGVIECRSGLITRGALIRRLSCSGIPRYSELRSIDLGQAIGLCGCVPGDLGIDRRRYVRVPDSRGFVIGRRDDAGAVGRVDSGFDHPIVAGEHGELCTRARIPDPRGLVGGCRDDAGAIGRVGGENDVTVMAGERGELYP
jgi:hypothetical protein